MLLSFKVKNFRSFKEEQEISFILNEDEHIEANRSFVINTKNREIRVLKNAVIYGANASGKTNLLLALQTLGRLIIHPASSDNQGLYFDTFVLNRDNTRFEIKFVEEDSIFEYHLEYNFERVVFENLYKNDLIVFERNHQEFIFPDLDESVETLLKTVRKTGLLIFSAQNFNVEDTKKAFSWFFNSFHAASASIINILKTDKGFKEKILYALQFADFNILDIEVEERKQVSLSDTHINIFQKEVVQYITEVYFVYENNGKKFRILLQNESQGTRAYFKIILLLLNPNNKKGSFLFRDELDLSLHKQLTYSLVELLNSEKNYIQFISTSHDSSIMNLLSKHQIYFIEKNVEGESEIFTLSDFEDIDEGHSDPKYASEYEAGLFGAEQIINDAGLMSIFGVEDE